MILQRYEELMADDDSKITAPELTEGWHWCLEFDGLLVGPGMGELGCCQCLAPDHPVYLTIPSPCDHEGE